MTKYKIVIEEGGGIIPMIENKEKGYYEFVDVFEFSPVYDNQEELKQEKGKGVINQWRA